MKHVFIENLNELWHLWSYFSDYHDPGGLVWRSAMMHHHPPQSYWRLSDSDCELLNSQCQSPEPEPYELWQKHYSVTNDEITSTSTINVTTVHIVRLEGEELVNRKCCKVIWIFLFVWNFCFSRQQLRQQQKEWKNLAFIDIFFLTSKISVKYVFVVSEMPCCYKGLFESKHYF